MDLSGRLKAIADVVPKSHKAADIGTDHGYVPLSLLQDHRIGYAIAADISAGSLNKAKMLIRQYHMEHCMETRLGGLLICDILEKDEAVARTASALVLQPMTAQAELRRWLVSNRYGIAQEDLAREEQRIYEIIVAVPGLEAAKPDQDIYYDIGWKLIEERHPLLGEFIRRKIRALEEIVAQLEAGKTASAMARRMELEERIRLYKEVFHCHIR